MLIKTQSLIFVHIFHKKKYHISVHIKHNLFFFPAGISIQPVLQSNDGDELRDFKKDNNLYSYVYISLCIWGHGHGINKNDLPLYMSHVVFFFYN